MFFVFILCIRDMYFMYEIKDINYLLGAFWFISETFIKSNEGQLM